LKPATPTSEVSAKLRQLSKHLFLFEDTCNVYLLKDGDAGLLIDAGSGAVTEVLADAGVTSLEWVLHTHHHRDQCWGTPGIVAECGVCVAVPEHERYLFESAREHWQTKRIFDNYNDRNTFFAPGEDIPVDVVLEDYEEFRWRGISFFVLPAKGHTFGSSALLAEIDGRLVAFTGDLLTAGGRLYQLHAMEYGYSELVGILFTLQSLEALRRRRPELVLPSHGTPIEAVEHDIGRLQERLLDIVRLGSGLRVAGSWPVGPQTSSLPEPRLVRLSEHLLFSGAWACSNFYVLLSGTGEALLIDYGHAFGAHMHIWADQQSFESMRFVAHHLEELEERFGVTSIEVVIPTHFHDDHVCGIPYLQRHHGTDCWALEEVAKILEAPAEWAGLPCTHPRPVRIDRRFADGERISWRGIELTFHHAPGQTEFHSVISTHVDGKTVAFTGDNYFLHEVAVDGKLEERPWQTTVLRNSFQLAMHRRCVEVMRAVEPELICPGHGSLLSCDKQALHQYADFVALKEQSFRAAVAEPSDHYIDLFWARLRPYVATVAPGETLEYTLMLRNNLERPATYAARLLPPPGWSTTRDLETRELDAGDKGEVTLAITAPTHLTDERTLVTAEILIDGQSQGPIAEALVSVAEGS
jgi:glyoxylase-like metal-dependent hydrolase (beta-lactamase superfamily II)